MATFDEKATCVSLNILGWNDHVHVQVVGKVRVSGSIAVWEVTACIWKQINLVGWWAESSPKH